MVAAQGSRPRGGEGAGHAALRSYGKGKEVTRLSHMTVDSLNRPKYDPAA